MKGNATDSRSSAEITISVTFGGEHVGQEGTSISSYLMQEVSQLSKLLGDSSDPRQEVPMTLFHLLPEYRGDTEVVQYLKRRIEAAVIRLETMDGLLSFWRYIDTTATSHCQEYGIMFYIPTEWWGSDAQGQWPHGAIAIIYCGRDDRSGPFDKTVAAICKLIPDGNRYRVSPPRAIQNFNGKIAPLELNFDD